MSGAQAFAVVTAEVVSGDDITVVVLGGDEVRALTELLASNDADVLSELRAALSA